MRLPFNATVCNPEVLGSISRRSKSDLETVDEAAEESARESLSQLFLLTGRRWGGGAGGRRRVEAPALQQAAETESPRCAGSLKEQAAVSTTGSTERIKAVGTEYLLVSSPSSTPSAASTRCGLFPDLLPKPQSDADSASSVLAACSRSGSRSSLKSRSGECIEDFVTSHSESSYEEGSSEEPTSEEEGEEEEEEERLSEASSIAARELLDQQLTRVRVRMREKLKKQREEKERAAALAALPKILPL
eukprot:TRINITY_DN26317_c0_g2_i2.p1 TRINITY_DN26317_c0_g2~~TRINITY_DN26317_c0_g2_i2.p1  ORF type:complete len:247 (-),score=52.16 TRINITY_DN26317_c0_g2_i2:442-1182(-)